jgi:hypothetical protein
VSRVARGGGSATVFRGGGATFVDKKIQPGVEYRFSVQTEDPAGNKSRLLSRLALPKVVSLRTRGYVPRTAGAPVLRLPAVAGASYYHVQLFRQGTRIFAAWPLKPQLALHTSWSSSGRSYRLTPGRYRWFAWAGFAPLGGALQAARVRPVHRRAALGRSRLAGTAGAIVGASATAAAASRTPKPRLGFQVP